MTISDSDFVSFDEALYKLKVAGLEDHQLQRKELQNIRTRHGGAASIIGGTVLAPATAGVTLAGAALGARTWQIACRKLEIIQSEMRRRGVPLHHETKRDKGIPAIFGLSGGMNASVGMEGSAATYAVAEVASKVAPKSGEGLSRVVSKETISRVTTAPARLIAPAREITNKLRRSLTDREPDDVDECRRKLDEKLAEVRSDDVQAS